MNLGPPLYVRYEPQLQPPPHPSQPDQAQLQLLVQAASIQPATIHTYRFIQSTCESILSNYFSRLSSDEQQQLLQQQQQPQQPRPPQQQPSPAPSVEHARGSSPQSSLSSYQEQQSPQLHIANNDDDDDDDDKQDSHSPQIPLVQYSPLAVENDNKQDAHSSPIPLVPHSPDHPPVEEEQQQQSTPPITSDIYQWPTNRSQLHNDDLFQRIVSRVTTTYQLTSHQSSCLLHQYINNVSIHSLISLFYQLVTTDIIDIASNHKPRSFTWLQLLHAIIEHHDADVANVINARYGRWFTVYKATKCISLHQIELEEIPSSMKEATRFLQQRFSSHRRRLHHRRHHVEQEQ